MEGFSRDMLQTASEASLVPTLDANGRLIRQNVKSSDACECRRGAEDTMIAALKPISLSKDGTCRRQRCRHYAAIRWRCRNAPIPALLRLLTTGGDHNVASGTPL